MGIHREKGGLTFARIERKTPVLRPALQSNQSFLCGLHCSRDRGGGGPNGQIVSVKRLAVRRRQRSREIADEQRGKYRPKNGSLRNTSTDSKGTTFVILNNHASALIRKERLNLTSKSRREASRNMFVEKSGMPDRVESFLEVDSREYCPTTWPEFVEPVHGGNRHGGERMELDSRNKSRHDRIMRSNSFDTQEVREIGRKGMQRPGKIENVWQKIHARAREVL